MPSTRVLACLLLAAACGSGKHETPIDARSGIDAPDNNIDASIDASIDAAVDARPDPVVRIWVVGDFLIDNVRRAGGFPSNGTLPFNTAMPPPSLVPASGALFAGAGATANVFDARGGKIAYIADETVAARFDLTVANADGTSPVVVVQGGIANVEITSVGLSPDGTKVAFTRDSVLIDGGYDLFVAPTSAAATPIQISPPRPVTSPAPANQDAFPPFEWSSDSKYVAFFGDLEDDTFDQAYVTDTTAVTPTPVTILTRADIATQAVGPQGVRSKIVFDKNNNLYFRARVSTANNSQLTFFKSDAAGTKTVIVTPARADTSVSDIGAFGITPDGKTIVFSADAPTISTYNLFAQAIVNPQTPTNLTSVTPIATAVLCADSTTPLFFSPDSTTVAVVANFLSGLDNVLEPFVVAVDGTGMRRLAAITAASNQDAEWLVWANNTTLFAQGDLAVNNDVALFKLAATTTDQTPTLALGPPGGGDLINTFVVAP